MPLKISSNKIYAHLKIKQEYFIPFSGINSLRIIQPHAWESVLSDQRNDKGRANVGATSVAILNLIQNPTHYAA
jgi:hypothetical protein